MLRGTKKHLTFLFFKVRGYLLCRMGFLQMCEGGLLGSAIENNTCGVIRKSELFRERVNCDEAVTEGQPILQVQELV